jgi:hypothetical protein
MDGTAKLQAIEDIRTLKARYFRYVDTKQWDLLPSLFTPDMKVVTPGGKLYSSGGGVFAESVQDSLAHCVSVHQGLTAEIEIIDEQNATGVWAMEDVIGWEDRHPKAGWKSIHGYGHYHETYRKAEGVWRIATLSLTRLRLDESWPDAD